MKLCCRFCCSLFYLAPHAHVSHSSSISTRASVVTFWLEVCRSVGRGKGREGSAAGAQLGSSFVPPGEAQCGGSSTALGSVCSRNTLEPCTWVTARTSCTENIFLSAYLCVFVALHLLCNSFIVSCLTQSVKLFVIL